MSAEVSIGNGDGARLSPHPLRAAILGEAHARPFTPIETPRRVLHFAFDTAGDRAQADRTALTNFAEGHGLAPLKPTDKQHRVMLSGTVLRWEQHSEFTTYTWELPAGGASPFHPPASSLAGPMARLPQPGPVLVALDLHLLANDDGRLLPERLFDRNSLAVAENSDGKALFASDFQTDPAGFVRILVIDRGLGAERAGALVQRIVELETYRTLALLGLPEAQRLFPSISRIEQRLAEVTEEMRRTAELVDNHRLLDELIRESVSFRRQPRLQRDRAAPLANHRRAQSRRLSYMVFVSGAAHGPGYAHLHHNRGTAGEPLAQALAHRQPVADASGRGGRAAEPRFAQIHE